MKRPFGHSHGRTYKSQLSNKSRRTEVVFHLNYKLNAPLNFTLLYALSLGIHPFKLLKSVKGEGGWVCILGRRAMVMLQIADLSL